MNEQRVGAFGVLKPIDLRVIFLRGTPGLKRVLGNFQKSYNLEKEPEMQKEAVQVSEDRSINFKYFEVDGHRFYTFLIGKYDEGDDRDAVIRYGGGIYDLVATKKSGAIIYVDHDAIPLFLAFGQGRFDKFHPILLHSSEDVEKYIESKIFFQDEKELLFRMLQIQSYIEKNVTMRGAFKQKEDRKQRRRDGSEDEEESREHRHRRSEDREDNHRELRSEHKPKNRAPAKQFNPRNKNRDDARDEPKTKPKQKGWNRQRDTDSEERIPSPRRDSSSDEEDIELLKAKVKYLEALKKKSHK